MADNNEFSSIKSELDEIYQLLQALSNNVSGLNTSAANLRRGAEEISKSAKDVSRAKTEELNELKGAFGTIVADSAKKDAYIKEGSKLLQSSKGIIDSAKSAMQSSMTFANKTMSDAFSIKKNMEQYRQDAQLEFLKSKAGLAEMEQELNEAINKMKEASEDYANNANYQAAVAQRDAIQKQKAEMDAIDSTKAYQLKAQNELKSKAINFLKSTIDTFAKYYQQAFSNAYNSIMNSYESNYGTVTSYNAYSKAEYDKIIDSMQTFISENGLKESINMSDYLDEVKGVLQGGLTGPLAEQVAKYSILSKEGGISAYFTDQSFQKMIKKVYDQKLQETGSEQEALAASEGLLEQIMTQSKAVIEETGDSFGFANGQINTMMNSIWEMSSIMNMTDEAVKKSTTSMTALNGVLGKTNMDTTAIYEQIEKYASEGFNGSSAQAMLNFSGMSSAQARAEIEKNGIGSMIEKTISGIYDKYSGNAGEFQKAINDALGSDYDLKSIQSMLSTYKTEEDFMKAYKGAMSAAQGADSDAYMAGLKEFNTEAEQLANYAENTMTDTAQLAQESNLIRIGVDKLVNYFTGTNVSTMFGSIADWGNLLLNYRGKGLNLNSIGGSSISNLGTMFNNGTAFASSGGTLAKIGSKVFSTGGKALGAAGSLISIGIDGVQGYKEDGWSGAIRGAVTGSGKAAESGWDVALGAGSGALKGAGIGMVFGPLGMAIGAASGGLIGLAVGLNDLLDTEKVLNRQYKNMSDAASQYSSNMLNYSENLSELSVTQNDAKLAAEGNVDATERLVAKWPQLIKYVDESGTLQGDYADTLETLLQMETEKIYRDNLYSSGEVYNNNSSLHAGNLKKNTEQTINNLPGADSLNSIESVLNSKSTAENVKKLSDSGSSYSFSSHNAVVQNTRTKDGCKSELAFNGDDTATIDWYKERLTDLGYKKDDIDTLYEEGGLYAVEGLAIKSGLFGDEQELIENNSYAYEAVNAYDAYYEKYKSISDQIESVINSLVQSSFTPEQIKNWNKFDSWSKLTLDWPEDAKFTPKNTFDRGFQIFQSLQDYANAAENSDIVKSKLYTLLDITDFKEFTDKYSGDSSPKALYDKYNDDAHFSYVPPFSTGLDYVPYDNFLARLHKGERVQTAAEVNLEKANYAANGSNKMTAALQDALVSQTDIIIDVLRNILAAITGKSTSSAADLASVVQSYAIGLPSNA